VHIGNNAALSERAAWARRRKARSSSSSTLVVLGVPRSGGLGKRQRRHRRCGEMCTAVSTWNRKMQDRTYSAEDAKLLLLLLQIP